jgi:hypothetical protein
MTKLKIVSDGNPRNTKILIDGEECKLPVTDVQVSVSVEGVTAVLTVMLPELELEIDEKSVNWILRRPPVEKEPKRWMGGRDA